jgi:hypothetical protein
LPDGTLLIAAVIRSDGQDIVIGDQVNINVIGTYTSASFQSANDGHGDTEVYDPPIVPNGGTSGTTNPPPTNSGNIGSTTAGGQGGYEFNHALFLNYAAVLSDHKAFGSATPVSDNGSPVISIANLTPPIFTQHHV